MKGNERDGAYVDPTAIAVLETAEIVVGLNDSASAAAALRWAARHSRVTGLPLRVVHAWQLTALEAGVGPASSSRIYEAAGAHARARATRWVLDTLGDAEDVRWTLDIVEGPPGPALVARSRGARLLVLGTSEHTGLRRFVLGSVSHYCLSHAEQPVLAVPLPLAAPSTEGSGMRALAMTAPAS